ncbi:hypothetical protein [Streptomyces sp. JHA26]|uniref:hypothetical protein n=1 Tax=Streptomyces sp. JHA26 TaxID=1917143 RepID=UPI0015C52D2C|nr:hypothetical protein [Streptomyces sp. JHA26]
MENWQKDAQPEWPDAMAGGRDLVEPEPQDVTQVLPETGALPGAASSAAGGPGWFGGAADAAETEVLRPQAGADLFGGTARRDRMGQGRIGQDRMGQGRIGQDRMGQGRIGQDRMGQGRIGQDRMGQGRIGQDRMGQGRIAQDRMGQGRTGQHRAPRHGDAPYGETDRTEVLPSAAQAALTRAFPDPATTALRDPWQGTPGALDADAPGTEAPRTADETEHTHDPHEVTVQLDAVQLGDGVIRRATSGPGKHAASEPSDGPVFVDESGRRSRRFRRIGIAVGGACAIYAVVIVSTLLSGNSNAPWLPVPGQEQGKPAGQVDTTPLPSQSAQPSTSGSADPRTSPSAGTGVTTSPGADAPAPGTSATARQPGTSADAGRPSSTATDPKPGGGGGGAVEPDPTATTQQSPPAATDPTTPADGGDETTVDPTPPTDGGTAPTDPGAGTTVNGASDTSPVAARTAAAPAGTSTSPSLSPEYTL